MKYFIRVLPYLRPYWHYAAGVVVLIVLAGLADLLSPWPLEVLVDNVLGDHPLPDFLAQFFGPEPDRVHLLITVVVGGLCIVIIDNLLTVLNNCVQTALEQKMILDFRGDLFQHAQRLSLAFHDKRRSGMLIYVINSQGDSVAGLLMTVPALAQSFITLIGMLWIVFHIDPGLALVSLIVIPFLFYSVRYYATRIQARLMHVMGMEGESLSIIHEALSMLRVIVAFGRENHEYRRFREQGKQAITARINVTIRQTLFSMVVNLTTALGTAAVLGYGAYEALKGRLTAGQLLVVISYIAAVYKPLETITYTVGSLQDKFMSQRIAFDLLETNPEVKDSPTAVALTACRGQLTFEAVDFSYEGREDTLRGISFDIQPSQAVAVVGPTGAGKSTLISLIPRFYDVQRGRILLDGVDIREISLRSLREQISMVLQEPLLFSGTVASNIRYGRLDATDEQIVEAARAANAHDFISKLPQGYETELGERGAKLSGGERQRICVARAFLKDAPILILDEPTSAIDSKTESVILDALDRLMVGRTSLMIAHRLSTIHRADQILVLDHGHLVQHGSHEELMLQDGLYKQLQQMQSRRPRHRLQSALEQLEPLGGE